MQIQQFNEEAVKSKYDSPIIVLFNARSTGPHKKRAHISNFITDNNVDRLFLVETCLKEVADEPEISDITSAGHTTKSFRMTPEVGA